MRVLKLSVVQDLDLLPHLESCRHVRCSKIVEYTRNLQTIRCVCRAFDNLIRSSEVSLYCITLSRTNLLPPDLHPAFHTKLARTLSIDIQDEDIVGTVTRRARDLAVHTRSLVRMVVKGGLRLWDAMDVMDSMRQCLNTLSMNVFDTLSVLVLNVPVDFLSSVRGQFDLRHLMLHSATSWLPAHTAVPWTRLESFELILNGDDQDEMLARLGGDEFGRLTTLSLKIFGGTTRILPLLSRTTSLTDLTLLCDPRHAIFDSIPECDTLQTIRCFINTGEQLFEHTFPSLNSIVLEGVFREIRGATRVPQVRSAELLDDFLVHLKSHEYVPTLRIVRIKDFRVSDFKEFSWFFAELAVYAYWGVQCQHTSFQFDFVDHEGRSILPTGFENDIPRMVMIPEDMLNIL